MSKTFAVFKHEITTLISRFSFWFGAIGIPLIAFGIYAVAGAVSQGSGGGQDITTTLSQVFSENPIQLPDGYVDKGDLIKAFPPFMNSDELIKFQSEEEARQALDDGKIDIYFILPRDYVKTGEITAISQNFALSTLDSPDQIEVLLDYNLLNQDLGLLDQVRVPMQLEEVSLSEAPIRDQDNMLTFFLPYGVTLLFYIMIMSSASLLLSSISKEKENRVIEILMVSVTPQQLLTGKMIGLGLVGLFQVVLWGGAAFILLQLSGRTFNLPPEFQLPAQILIWGLIFFILGFLLYACLMSGLGALVPNIREASQTSFVISLPMLIPLLLVSVLIEDPNGILATILSLFPLTASITMMLRLTATVVPLWQILLSIALLLVAVFLAIRAAAGMFRAQSLLSGQQFKLKIFFKALIGRA